MNGYIPPVLAAPRPAQYRMRLTVQEHSARYIRRIVRFHLREWDLAELADAVELGVTELVANVVRHVPDRCCEVLLLRVAAGVRVEVADGSSRLPVVPAGLSMEAEGGRGLLLVDAVADKWGVEARGGGGKTVWFECGVEGDPSLGTGVAGKVVHNDSHAHDATLHFTAKETGATRGRVSRETGAAAPTPSGAS